MGFRPRQPVSVAGIQFDALIESNENYTATVPKYPIDNGYSVSDNMALDNLDLKMTLYLTATPITWRGNGTGLARMQSVCDQLMQLYFDREVFTVVTQDKTFERMVVESIEIKKSEDQGFAREIPVSFRQITVTQAGETAIAPSNPRSGTTATSTGSATTSTSGGSGGTASSTSSGGTSSGGGGAAPSGGGSPQNDTSYTSWSNAGGGTTMQVLDWLFG